MSNQALIKSQQRAMLISILVHLVIIHGVILTFTLKAVAHKPIFFFLGSILEREEFLGLETDPRTSSRGTQQAFDVTSSEGALYPTVTTYVRKPVFSDNVEPQQKYYAKTNFLNEQDYPPTKDVPLEDMGIEPQAPARIPLHINP